MQLDGKPEESDKVKRSRLTTAINRYEKLLSLTNAEEDPVLFKSLQDHIADAKAAIIALNPPEDQLKNLQGAILRKQKIASNLTSQVSALQNQLQEVEAEVSSLQLMEKKLQDQLSYVRIVVDSADSDQLLQLKLQHSQLQSQFQSERKQMVELLQQLQTVPGMPENALALLPLTLGVVAPSTPVPESQPSQTPPGISEPSQGKSDPPIQHVVSPTLLHAQDPVPDGFPTGFEPLGENLMEADEPYGPSTTSHSRPSPYGTAAAATDATTTDATKEVFREVPTKQAES